MTQGDVASQETLKNLEILDSFVDLYTSTEEKGREVVVSTNVRVMGSASENPQIGAEELLPGLPDALTIEHISTLCSEQDVVTRHPEWAGLRGQSPSKYMPDSCSSAQRVGPESGIYMNTETPNQLL
ncbi:hypothetical protein R1flu_024654 [Riccia fluitans]|uniref:Uncharacterized protein n=1 Tax=Riccia fluitans TaxID=41844 RepID=A0ABD1XVI1_9MARC